MNFSHMKFVLLLVIIYCFALFAQEPLKVACVGNSITYGAGIADQVNDSYPAQLQKLLGDEYTVLNCGNSGRTMLKHGDYPLWVESEFKAAIEMVPNIVVILLGTNDSKPYNWIYKDEFIPDYIAMIDTFRAVNSEVKIYACLPPPAFAVQWDIRDSVITTDIIPMIRQIADSTQVETIDFYQPLIDANVLFPDDIHPNAEGAWEMAKIAYRTMMGINIVEMKDVDLAKNKQVAATSPDNCSSPHALVDGDWRTKWSCMSSGSAVVDLGAIESIDLFQTDFGDEGVAFGQFYTIEVSADSVNWIMAVDKSAVGDSSVRMAIDRIDPLDARYVKLSPLNHVTAIGEAVGAYDFRVLRTAPIHAPAIYIDNIEPSSRFTRYKYYVLPVIGNGYHKVVYSSDVDEPFTDVKGYRISAAQNSSGSVRPDRVQRYYTKAYCDGIEVLSADTLTVDWSISAIESKSNSAMPERYHIENYPNPFNSATIIRFQLSEQCYVALDVYNVNGQCIANLMDAEVSAGYHSVVWEAKDQPSGVYLCHIRAGDATRTSRMVLLK